MSKRTLKDGKWERIFDYDFHTRTFFTIITDRFQTELSGGSVMISDKNSGKVLYKKSGFHYLYTGDVSPDEKTLVALENGKHFYVFSLDTFTLEKRVTVPRGYESIDFYPSYSADGSVLTVPVSRYCTQGKQRGYQYCLCRYETQNYGLLSVEEVGREKIPFWPSMR